MAPARLLPSAAALLLLLAALPAPAQAYEVCLIRNPGSPRCVMDAQLPGGVGFTGVRVSEWHATMVCPTEDVCTPWIVTCVGVGVWVRDHEVFDTDDDVCELVP